VESKSRQMFTQETVPQLKDVLQIWLGLFLMLQRVEGAHASVRLPHSWLQVTDASVKSASRSARSRYASNAPEMPQNLVGGMECAHVSPTHA